MDAIQLLGLTLIFPMLGLWIWSFLDCVRRDFVSKGDKVIWMITIVFGYVFGASAYFFLTQAERRKIIQPTRPAKT